MHNIIDTLFKLEEEIQKAREKFIGNQSQIKRWFNYKFTWNNEFNIGDLVLKWDKAHEEKGKHTKLQAF